jgi:hypothetical protein
LTHSYRGLPCPTVVVSDAALEALRSLKIPREMTTMMIVITAKKKITLPSGVLHSVSAGLGRYANT